MTNIANKIYNHATVLAGNLRAKGVPDVTANMGLADLIDKVLDIDQASNGLYLFSDKKIAQSGNTINLSSMILEDKQIKPGETITFYYTFIDKKMKVNEEIQIPSQFQNYDWDITIEKTSASGQIRLPKKNISEYILLGASSITLPSNQVIPVNNPCYKIRGNVIYFDDNSISISADFDKTWVSNSLASTHVSITTLIPVVVQNNGLATYSMTCDGSGKKSFYTTYGNFVSETYSIWDYIFYDSGVTGTANSNYVVVGGSGTKTVEDDGTTLSNSNATRYDIFTNVGSTSSVYDYQPSWCFEIDILSNTNGGCRFQIYDPNGGASDGVFASGQNIGHWKITYDGTTLTAQRDDITPLSYARNMQNARIGFTVPQNDSIKFKNVKIYSI